MDGWMDGWMGRRTDTERRMISGGFIVVIQDKGISGRRWGWGKRADNSSGSLLLLPQLRDGHDPLLRLLLTPQTTFPHGRTREMAAAAAYQELHPGDKKNQRNVLARLASLSSQGCKWLSCSHRFKKHFISQQKYS